MNNAPAARRQQQQQQQSQLQPQQFSDCPQGSSSTTKPRNASASKAWQALVIAQAQKQMGDL